MSESSKTLTVLGLLFAGFVSGFSVSQFLSKDSIFSGGSAVAASECSGEKWRPLAESADWTPKNECPAYPLRLSISSPGSLAYISSRSSQPDLIHERVVVNSSRPLPEGMKIFLAAQAVGSPNLHVSRERLYSNSENVATTIGSISLGFDFSKYDRVRLWAFAAADDGRVGDLYAGIEQLEKGVDNAYVSDPVELNIASTPD